MLGGTNRGSAYAYVAMLAMLMLPPSPKWFRLIDISLVCLFFIPFAVLKTTITKQCLVANEKCFFLFYFLKCFCKEDIKKSVFLDSITLSNTVNSYRLIEWARTLYSDTFLASCLASAIILHWLLSVLFKEFMPYTQEATNTEYLLFLFIYFSFCRHMFEPFFTLIFPFPTHCNH